MMIKPHSQLDSTMSLICFAYDFEMQKLEGENLLLHIKPKILKFMELTETPVIHSWDSGTISNCWSSGDSMVR